MAESKELSVSTDETPETPGTAASPDADAQAEQPAEPAGPSGPESYRLRRAPRYRAFGFTGVLTGIVVGLVLALSFQATGDYSTQTILGYFVAIFGMLGALIGCGAAVLLDRRKD
ncbi:hypothetical protein KIH74_27450 [Kineosporia sp. J2-2]|uniref:Uncharacterized protein n=1 Tax=Kineosporia corallincola TaxID=2835133 RepID=A0ABS5TNN5_9ACTN|nr:hypothetical protein [Kineosporia corallincola]MBT0772711.1 hypothetical protein [Kineosporia corallincola]